jgi:hypothetical protein
MSDSTISAMPPADLPLTTEPLPVVQGGATRRTSALALGIPVVSSTAPTPLAQYQTWIDTSTVPPSLRVCIGTSWVALFRINSDGQLGLMHSPTLAADPTDPLHAATKRYADTKSNVNAVIYKGVKPCAADPLYPAADKGDVYLVSSAGHIGGSAGISVSIGDLLWCLVDGTSAGTQASVGASWTIVQGHATAVIGPSSSVDGGFAQYDGTTGKLIKGGIVLDTDATMAANSDTRVPSQKAVKASLGGQRLGADTLTQGQGWLWDGVSSTFRARTADGENLLVNSAFDVWQENTSYVIGNSAPKIHIADFWKAGASGLAQKTISRVAGLSGSQYALKFQRNPGASDGNRVHIAQQFGTAESMYLVGRAVTVSFDFLAGADLSWGSGPYVNLFYGTGIEEDFDLRGNSMSFPTNGGFLQTLLLSQVPPPGTVVRMIAQPLTIPVPAVGQPAITEVLFHIGSGGFSGVAGNDDSFTIGNIKLEIGNIATPYRKPDPAGELRRCQRRYWKSFAQSMVPGQGAGTGTSEHRGVAIKSGASAQSLGTVRTTTLRVAPTVTLFNPVSSNAQARDLTAGADCSATSAQNVSDSGFEIVTTANASTAVGNTIGVHVVADARL